MTEWAVVMENISKSYRIRKTRDASVRAAGRTFHALQNIDLKIRSGEIMGLLGPNGAGKSTLLKILTGVTRPTGGRYRVTGRVHALLELGTGFHPDLNGYENLFIGGALHGFSRRTIQQRLDSILAFAGIGDAIDQPLHTYSSGMYLRLAYALMIHLDPDILLLDEILAVGDEPFQRKCFDTIRTFKARGVTIVFVSHDLSLLTQLCDRAALVNDGRIVMVGGTDDAVTRYRQMTAPRITAGEMDLILLDNGLHPHYRHRSLAGLLGLYTSFRIDGRWYDPTFMEWSRTAMDAGRVILEGRFANLPVGQTWELHQTGTNEWQWDIRVETSKPIHIQRIQTNIMLNRNFNAWQTPDSSGMFPASDSTGYGEDWNRVWIGAPDRGVTLTSSREPFAGDMHFQPETRTGALLVVDPPPEYRGRLVQHLQMFPEDHRFSGPARTVFRGRVALTPADPSDTAGLE